VTAAPTGSHGEGPLANRPPAASVPDGWRWYATDERAWYVATRGPSSPPTWHAERAASPPRWVASPDAPGYWWLSECWRGAYDPPELVRVEPGLAEFYRVGGELPEPIDVYAAGASRWARVAPPPGPMAETPKGDGNDG
jgi:hypothetical protein